MRAGGSVLGALGLFGTTPGALALDDLATAQTLAHLATVALLQERPPSTRTVLTRLGTALADRTVVEQARGYLSETLDVDVDVDVALRLLREQARDTRIHLSELARDLMTAGEEREVTIRGIRARRV